VNMALSVFAAHLLQNDLNSKGEKMKQGHIQWLHTGRVGVVSLDIPVITFGGNKKPRIAITSSVHGDEPLGLVVISRLVDYLDEQNLAGTVSLVLAANPAAQLLGQRVSPQDFKDLNRAGAGNAKGYYTDRLAANLFEFLRNFDFVVNIHEFEMHTPVTAFYIGEGNSSTKQRILDGIEAFAPEIVWVAKHTNKRDNQYLNTLDAALARAGVPSFIVETVQLPFITEREINHVVNGVIRLMALLGIVTPKNRKAPNGKKLTLYRNEITTDVAGLWEPRKLSLFTPIKAGDVIGEIRTIPEFTVELITAPISGTLIQLRHRQLVGTGSSIFSIGTKAVF